MRCIQADAHKRVGIILWTITGDDTSRAEAGRSCRRQFPTGRRIPCHSFSARTPVPLASDLILCFNKGMYLLDFEDKQSSQGVIGGKMNKRCCTSFVHVEFPWDLEVAKS
jgi:hypothetical protein